MTDEPYVMGALTPDMLTGGELLSVSTGDGRLYVACEPGDPDAVTVEITIDATGTMTVREAGSA